MNGKDTAMAVFCRSGEEQFVYFIGNRHAHFFGIVGDGRCAVNPNIGNYFCIDISETVGDGNPISQSCAGDVFTVDEFQRYIR